jgi:hypothetical protein
LNLKTNGTVGSYQPSYLNFQQIKFGTVTEKSHFQTFLLVWISSEQKIFNLFQIGALHQICRFRPNTPENSALAPHNNRNPFFLQNIGQSHFIFQLSILGHL